MLVCTSNLFEAIQERWRSSLPAYMWDSNFHRLHRPFFLILDGKILDDINAPLEDKQHITIRKRWQEDDLLANRGNNIIVLASKNH